MKTLDQIEPRIPIDELPYVIDTSGSYYLTGPLTSTNVGITVSANHVTLDLMGFTLYGSSNSNYPGIHIAGGNEVMLHNVVVRNGGITQFGVGIQVDNTMSGVLRNLIVHQNTADGIVLESHDPGLCANVTVEDCTVTDNAGIGIAVYSPSDNHNYGHVIRNNLVSGNVQFGVDLIRSDGCLVDGNRFGPHVYVDGFALAVRSSLSRSFIVRNFEWGNSTNAFGVAYWQNGSTSTFGPPVSKGGYLSTNNFENHPWANFSR